MSKSFVLMAAMPPTLGHVDLINFSRNLTGDTKIIVVTRGQEPYQTERVQALAVHYQNDPGVEIFHLHLENVTAEGNPYWAGILSLYGFAPGDILVASETWGGEIAEMLSGEFFPYDIAREIRYTKAAAVREDLAASWSWIIPEFQKMLQKRIVIFGAESTGKTTLMRALRDATNGSVGIFEYARPLLEQRAGELDVSKMMGIWRGQKALQETVAEMTPVPQAVFLDTDLYLTLGYWEFWQPETVPADLLSDAELLKADLYVLLKSDIPFEADPIRLGGNKREQTDDYWKAILEEHQLPYIELTGCDLQKRVEHIQEELSKIVPSGISYLRQDLDQ